MGLRRPLRPLRPCEIVADSNFISFGYGRDPYREVTRLLNSLISIDVVKKYRIKNKTHFWLQYKIKSYNKNDNQNENIIDLWKKIIKLRKQILETMIPESAKAILEILNKLRKYSGKMLREPLEGISDDLKKNYHNTLHSIIAKSEEYDRLYQEFYDTCVLPKEEEVLFTQLNQLILKLNHLINLIDSKKRNNHEDSD